MKHFFFIVPFFLLSILGISAKTNSEPNFTLTGKIKGQLYGKITLSYQSNSVYKRDTANIKDGLFKFTGYILEPTSAWLDGGNENGTDIWLEPAKLQIMLTKNHFEKSVLTGSKTQNESMDYKKFLSVVVDKRDSIRTIINLTRDSIKNVKNTELKQVLEKKVDNLWSLWSEANDKIPARNIQYIKLHPKSFIAINELYMLNRNDKISLDSMVAIFSKFDIKVQKGSVGKEIHKDILIKTNNKIGAIAPDFNVPDRNNKNVKLSDFKGKSIVLLDFWASWCSPCRQSFKSLKPLYQRLHSKGFEVIAIDTDRSGDDKAWAAAIEKDSISMWYHVKVAKDYPHNKITDEDIYSKYFVQGIPRKILIDKNGIIVGNWMGTSENIEKEVIAKIEELLTQ
jgi:peroxiredoxin